MEKEEEENDYLEVFVINMEKRKQDDKIMFYDWLKIYPKDINKIV